VLTLEGLELRRDDRDRQKTGHVEFIIESRQAPIRVANCRFEVKFKHGGAAIVGLGSPLFEARNCLFISGGGKGSFVGWVCPSGGRLLLENNAVVAAQGLAYHYRENDVQDVSLRLARNTISGSATLLLLDTHPRLPVVREGGQPPLRLEVAENVFAAPGVAHMFTQAQDQYVCDAKFLAPAEAEGFLRALVAWRERRNVSPEGVPLLLLFARGEELKSTRPLTSVAEWEQFWRLKDTGSSQADIHFRGDDVRARAAAAPGQLTPDDLRLAADSKGYRAGEGGRDLGADLDLVGPGAAYERWKTTAEYQDWLRQTPPLAKAPFDAATAQSHQEAWAKHYGAPTEFADSVGLKLRLIPPGRFTMGSPKNEAGRHPRENQVEVTIARGFWLGKYEVTQAEWTATMATQPWKGQEGVKEGGAYPATHVSWEDAVKFCQTITRSEQTAGRLADGWEYRLPTEAQWEFACRAGTQGRFGFGAEKSLAEHAWLDANAKKAGENYAHEVGKKQANAWGLHDMHGNVWEWCRDGFIDQLPGGVDPEVAQEGPVRVYRGGSCLDDESGCRSAARFGNKTDFRMSDVGFRVALVPARADPAASPLRTQPAAAGVPFVVLDAASKKEHKFATLADAVAAAQGGDTIEVRGNGPFVSPPVDVKDKVLTIRAGAGFRPVIQLSKDEQPLSTPLLHTRAALVLEGLELRRDDRGREKAGHVEYVIQSTRAPIRLANCRFEVNFKESGGAVVAFSSLLFEARNCLFVCGDKGVFADWVCPSGGRLILENNAFVGTEGLTFHYRENDVWDASVRLARNTVSGMPAGLHLDTHAKLPAAKEGRPEPPLRLDASDNIFAAPNLVFSFVQYQDQHLPEAKVLPPAEAESFLRQLLGWRERRNVYPEGVSFLGLFHPRAEQALKPTRPRASVANWEQFWGLKDTGSSQGPIRFRGGDVRARAAAAPGQVSADDLRLAADSKGRGAGEGGRDLGADLGLVGTGAAYERWKTTPDYQTWLKGAGPSK
jgi:formylglycine-generating enzyme required for sulfatase activity